MANNVQEELARHKAQVFEGAKGATEEFLNFLARSFKSLPEFAVAAEEFQAVTKTIEQTVRKIGHAELRATSTRIKTPKILKHWLTKLADPKVWEFPLDELSGQFTVLRFTSGILELDFQLTPHDLKNLQVSVILGGKRFELQPTGEEAGHYLFHQEIAQSEYFRLSEPFESESSTFLAVEVRVGKVENWRRVPLEFRATSHLSNLRFQSWRKDGYSFTASKTQVTIQKTKGIREVFGELLYILATTKSELQRGVKSALRFLIVRIGYWLTYPVLGSREIWITHDKMFSALDCGEYMYWYMHKEQSNRLHAYYAINANAKDVKRLQKMGANLLFPGSIKHSIYYLHAKVILTTHSNPASYNGFSGRNSVLYRDLMNARILCIQHGLTMPGLYKTMHQGKAGIERLYCASKYEIENVTRAKFGYKPEQLSLSGLARFDGLDQSRKDVIMISPTWRPELAGKSVGLTKQRKANRDFLDSEFFRLYAEILENKALLETAKARGYKLQFVLHPIMAASAPLMREGLGERAKALGLEELQSEVVQVYGAGIDAVFDDLIKDCAALVTDFSGIQYDVAYMMKEVVYFHPKELPAQYDHGVMNYETMGFGPVLVSSKKVADELKALVDSRASLPEKYRKRIEVFFADIDDQNCKRIFEDAAKFVGLEKR